MTTLPTIAQLYANARADLDSEFGVNISLIKKVALRAIAAVHAGKLWLWYKVLGFVQKNIWPDTADSEFKGGTLERFGRVRLGRNPDPAVAGQYTVEVTGTIGAIIPAQQTFKSDDDALSPGFLFILDAIHTMVGTTDTITLRALTPGVEAQLAVGNTLTPTSPIALVDSVATVTVESVQPLAAETLEAYRAAILAAFRLEAQGGAATDYRIWAADAQGVQKVYPYAKDGETNANDIYVEATVADSTDGKGTPSQATLDDVEDVTNFNPDTSLPLNERGRRPNTVINYFLPVTPKTVNIDITGFTGVTAAQQALLLQALTAAVNLIRPFVAAADILDDKNDIIDTNKINGIIYSQIPGAVYTGVTLYIDGTPLSSYTFTLGDIPAFGTLTFN